MNFRRELDIRQEFMERYIYLYNNIDYILAYYMVLDEDIYLDKIDNYSLHVIEEFLMGIIPYQETKFYLELEKLKTNEKFLKIIKKGHQLLDKKNQKYKTNYTLNVYTLLVNLRNYILAERVDLVNRDLKLDLLDEYFRLNNYKLNGKIKTTGFDNSFFNEENRELLSNYSYERDERDFGVLNNYFINYFANTKLRIDKTNANFLTINEKEKVYKYLMKERSK